MPLIALFTLTFFAAFGLGAVKYYGLGILLSPSQENPEWIAQALGAAMTLGPLLIFPIVMPMGKKYAKSWTLAVVLMSSAALALSGVWITSHLWVWIQLFSIGLLLGILGMLRSSIIPATAERHQLSLTFLNGLVSIFFIVALLSGLIFGRASHESGQWGGWITLAIFFCIPLPFLPFLKVNQAQAPHTELSWLPAITQSLHLIEKRGLYVLSSACIWGIASSLTLAVTLQLETLQIATPVQAAMASVFAAVGSIIGNLVSSKFHKKPETLAASTTLLFSFSLLAWIPLLKYASQIPHPYLIASAYITFQGFLFGLITNLLDAKFLKLCYETNEEMEGATLQSSAISFFSFTIGSLSGFLLITQLLNAFQLYPLLALISTITSAAIFLLCLQYKNYRITCLNLLNTLTSFLLKRRYRIQSNNIPTPKNEGYGTLILPNHPAEIDPVIVQNQFWKTHQPRPVMDSSFYELKLIHPIMKAINAFPMIDLNKNIGSYTKWKVEAQLDQVIQALKNGENVLFYPAGQLKRGEIEKLGSKSGLYKILKALPQVNTLLVKMDGLWGSRFSTQPHQGKTPELIPLLIQCTKDLISNLGFFMPKRPVHLHIEDVTGKLQGFSSARELNRHLENWYNSSIEKQSSVKTHFWKTSTPPSESVLKEETSFEMTSEHQPLLDLVASFTETSKDDLHLKTQFSDDLELDSLAKVELFSLIDEELELQIKEPENIDTLQDLLLNSTPNSRNTDMNSLENWPQHTPSQHSISLADTQNIAKAFLNKSDEMLPDFPLLADGPAQAIDIVKFKQCLYTLTMALKGDDYPLGICLPASSLAGAGIIAANLCQRTAVPLNWTTGEKAWNHAIQSSGLKTILTSKKFLAKAKLPMSSSPDIQWLIWEDILADLTVGQKLNILYKSKKNASHWIREFQLDEAQPHDTAVLLFTSGSESLPKGVPLSHHNLLQNIHACHDRMSFKSQDILMGFLPPFHAFGLTVTTLLPLLSGLKVVFSPNPTDTKALIRHIKNWKPTYVCGTPTFFKHLLLAGKPGDLQSLHTYVSGAEACAKSIKEQLQTQGENVRVLEGYGITEAGPVVCLQDHQAQAGVGTPLQGVELCIVDPNQHQRLKEGQTGLILARGENFFKGYLNSEKNPFIEIEGQAWYNTGDLGKIETDGSLVLEGRLSRFIKVGGEMVSLPALEKALQEHLGEEVQIALMPIEKIGERPTLTLFSNSELDLKETNQVLRQAGFSTLSRIHKCRQIREIPTLGSGKTDFNQLKTLLQEAS